MTHLKINLKTISVNLGPGSTLKTVRTKLYCLVTGVYKCE